MTTMGNAVFVIAHAGTGLAGGFSAGFTHPFGGLDHLLAMVSVGLWGAFLGEPLIYRLPVVFPGLMVAGAMLGMVTRWRGGVWGVRLAGAVIAIVGLWFVAQAAGNDWR